MVVFILYLCIDILSNIEKCNTVAVHRTKEGCEQSLIYIRGNKPNFKTVLVCRPETFYD